MIVSVHALVRHSATVELLEQGAVPVGMFVVDTESAGRVTRHDYDLEFEERFAEPTAVDVKPASATASPTARSSRSINAWGTSWANPSGADAPANHTTPSPTCLAVA